MIEKLPFTEIHSGGEDMVDRVEFKPVQSYEMQHKINELVDAVNELCSKNVHIDTEVRSQNVIDELDRTRKALDKGMEHITGLNNMIESWLNLINSDLDQETKLHILKSAISAYVENKGGNNEK